MFDAEQFLNDYGIQHWIEGKNVTRGWVNISCPFCRDSSNHGGFNPKKAYYHCWNCGWHPLEHIITMLTREPARPIIERYTTGARYHLIKKDVAPPEVVELPFGSQPLSARHRTYLEKRGFDPDRISADYKLKGTGHLGDYPWRIICPIFLNGKLVSYQGRDITNMQMERYKACKQEDEIINHKFILYDIDRVEGRSGIAVEGITDVWRLGAGAVGTFGTSVKPQQVTMLAERFDRIFILFDPETEAQEKASLLGWELNALGKEVVILELEGADDPGSMPQDEADNMMRELLLR